MKERGAEREKRGNRGMDRGWHKKRVHRKNERKTPKRSSPPAVCEKALRINMGLPFNGGMERTGPPSVQISLSTKKH